jgi:signal transduction histidine kinase
VIDERLRSIRLLAGLPDSDLEKLSAQIEEIHLRPGDVLFAEGEEGEMAYLIAEGELEVVKAVEGGEVRLAVRGPGEVMGEMALLRHTPRSATVRAQTPVCLLALGKAHLDSLLASSPSAARAMFNTVLERWQQTQGELRQNERMAQLGTLTAGIAHELNNPAAAVKRAAGQLVAALDRYRDQLEEAARELGRRLAEATAVIAERIAGQAPSPGALARSDREGRVEEWLTRRDPGAARFAPELADAGIDREDLDHLETLFGAQAPATAKLMAVSSVVARLVKEIGEGTGRLSGIVSALKSYTYLDQAPVQDVDIVRGIEDTLLILGHKLRGVEVVREYREPVPLITALGSQLNQVWTNLIDNAADAVAAVDHPRIVLRVTPEDHAVAVEIEDNGPGIAEGIRPKVFDAFFTTKPPGSGTGLGLSISYRIVLDHRGRLTFHSEPGATVFRVEIPVESKSR